MDTTARLVELRRLLYLDGTEPGWWRSVSDIIADWPDESVAVAAEYLHGHLDQLPTSVGHRSLDDRVRNGHLSLESAGLQPLDALWLARSDVLRRVRRLSLIWNDLGPIGAKLLFPSMPADVRVEAMNLGGNNIGPVGARALGASKALRVLSELQIHVNKLGTAGAEALAAARFPLDRLLVSSNELGVEGMQHLAQGRSCRGLSWLSAGHNGLGDEGFTAFLRGRWYPRVVFVAGDSLRRFSDVGPDHALVDVEYLDLSNNRIDDEGLNGLLELLQESPLRALVLRTNEIGDPGFAQLASSSIADTLEHLELSNNRLTDVSGRQWCQRDLFPRLRRLRLTGNSISEGVARRLSQTRHIRRIPNCWIVED